MTCAYSNQKLLEVYCESQYDEIHVSHIYNLLLDLSISMIEMHDLSSDESSDVILSSERETYGRNKEQANFFPIA